MKNAVETRGYRAVAPARRVVAPESRRKTILYTIQAGSYTARVSGLECPSLQTTEKDRSNGASPD
jgi:hypothetical protein